MIFTRRDFLAATAGLAVATLGSPGCISRTSRQGLEPRAAVVPPFLHGVASGDPLVDRVILWTRITPPPDSPDAAEVRWEVASDPTMRSVASRGRARAQRDSDYTVKIDAGSLHPGRAYYYRFDALGEASPVGRTRTLPVGRVENLRFGVTSCSNYPEGFFNAYTSLAERVDLDAVLHLGDYIYEMGREESGSDAIVGREVDPRHEILSLSDYRTRYAQYRSDPDLQAVHRQHPFIAVWDDHEIANNAWRDGAENHDAETEGSFAARRRAAVRAYFEWMPIRESTPGRIYRSFRFGDLVDLIMLDTRLAGRDRPVTSAGSGVTEAVNAIMADPARSILGRPQEAWLSEQLRSSQEAGTAWRVLGQQVMLATRSLEGTRMNADSWDGYRASRANLLEQIGPGGVPEVVTLSGDIHSSWAMEVTHDPFDQQAYRPGTGIGAVGVEFVAPAISSTPAGFLAGSPEQYAAESLEKPHVSYVDVVHNGYLLLDVDHERAQASWYFQRDLGHRGADEFAGPVFGTARGSHRLHEVTSPSGHSRA